MAAFDRQNASWTYVLDEPMRVLLADDDPVLREFASVYLSTPSATIDAVGDGAAAWARLQQQHYDVLLLDIEMPQLDGYALLQRIRTDSRLRNLPVIMLTGREDIASIDRAYRLGASSFTTKPVNWRQLSYHIRYVVRASRALSTSASSEGAEEASGPKPTASARDVQDFLQSITDRAATLAQQLSADDHGHCSELLRDIETAAQQTLLRCSGRGSSPPEGTCGSRTGQDDPPRVQPPPDRKSIDVLALQR
jgi:DNA-binding response OmpR family regulator